MYPESSEGPRVDLTFDLDYTGGRTENDSVESAVKKAGTAEKAKEYAASTITI